MNYKSLRTPTKLKPPVALRAYMDATDTIAPEQQLSFKRQFALAKRELLPGLVLSRQPSMADEYIVAQIVVKCPCRDKTKW
jgi:hypothetical protein